MSIGRYYTPQKSNYVSQFAPEEIPWDIAYKALERKEDEEIALRKEMTAINKDLGAVDIGINMSDPYGNKSYSSVQLDDQGNPVVVDNMTSSLFSGEGYGSQGSNLQGLYESRLEPYKNRYTKDVNAFKDFVAKGGQASSTEGRALAVAAQQSKVKYQNRRNFYVGKAEEIRNLQSKMNEDENIGHSGYRWGDYAQELYRYAVDDNATFDNSISVSKHIDMPTQMDKYTSQLGDSSYSSADYADIENDGTQFKVKQGGSTNAERLTRAMNAAIHDPVFQNDMEVEAREAAKRAQRSALQNGATEEEAEQIGLNTYQGVKAAKIEGVKNHFLSKLNTNSTKDVSYDAGYTERKEEKEAQSMVQGLEMSKSLPEEEIKALQQGGYDNLSKEIKDKLRKRMGEFIQSSNFSDVKDYNVLATYLYTNKDEINN